MIDIQNDSEYILDTLDGTIVIDKDEKIKFMSKDLLDTIGMDSLSKVKDRKLRDVIGTNNTYKVLETGKPQIAETYFFQGYTIVSNAHPIYKDGKLIGAIEYDIFQDIDNLQDFLDKISSEKDLKQYTETLVGRRREKYSLDSIKGSGQSIQNTKNEIKLASRSNSTVLVTGETGTGKELIAQAVHYNGHRALFDFVEVNCTTIPAELFESELFGYEEGSFTGARKGGKKGLAELADRGTLFLDEVNALPLPLQAKLLRFLQEKTILRVGGDQTIPLDIRIIAATNENLSDLVEAGKFRKDLFYRLNVIEIVAEPLRKRITDIPELVNFFIGKLNNDMGRYLETNHIMGIDTKALKLLMDYSWPGNVRELQNVVERAMNRCDGTMLETEHFEELLTGGNFNGIDIDEREIHESTLKEMTKNVEKRMIGQLIIDKQLSVTQVASKLGISRQMLHRKMNEYGIKSK